MRIIAGSARGQPLATPRGDTTRPTSDRVREAVFSSLGDRVRNATALDLYAGSGALGLEAASRGARSVVFVERHRAALVALEKNFAAVRSHPGFAADLRARREDVFLALNQLAAAGARFELIFADPPYGAASVAQQLWERHSCREGSGFPPPPGRGRNAAPTGTLVAIDGSSGAGSQARSQAQRLLDDTRLPALLAPGGLLVLESAKRDRVAPPAGWRTTREAAYGDTVVRFLASHDLPAAGCQT